nr:hypothetical protein [Candidatus Sigynarchaeota archaeon]
MLKTVSYPDFIRHGISPNHRSFTLDKNLRIFGVDTETLDGAPWTVQAHDGHDTLFAYVNERTIFPRLMSWLEPRCREHGCNLAYLHNLKFDIPVLFSEKRDNIFEQVNDITFTYKGWEIKMLFGKINTFEARRGDYLIKFVDSFAFTTTSLAKSLKMFGCEGRKSDTPKFLGEKPLKDAAFEAYAKNDAVIQYELACKILDFHKKYTVRPSISLP